MKALVPAWRVNPLSHQLFDEFDQIFAELMRAPASDTRWNVACDIEESNEFLLFSFDLPGLEEKDIQVEVDGQILKVSGERKPQGLQEEGRSWRGRQYGQFFHSFKLPTTLELDKIEADYTQGVLKILIPKQAKEVAKKIEVKAKSGKLFGQLFKSKDSTQA